MQRGIDPETGETKHFIPLGPMSPFARLFWKALIGAVAIFVGVVLLARS